MRPESSPSRRGWPPIMVHKADDFKRFPYFLFVRIDCTPTHSLIQSSKYQALFWGDFGAHLAGIVQPHAEILQLPVEIGQPHTLESCSRPLGVVRVVLGVVRLVRGVLWGVGRIVLGVSALFGEERYTRRKNKQNKKNSTKLPRDGISWVSRDDLAMAGSDMPS